MFKYFRTKVLSVVAIFSVITLFANAQYMPFGKPKTGFQQMSEEVGQIKKYEVPSLTETILTGKETQVVNVAKKQTGVYASLFERAEIFKNNVLSNITKITSTGKGHYLIVMTDGGKILTPKFYPMHGFSVVLEKVVPLKPEIKKVIVKGNNKFPIEDLMIEDTKKPILVKIDSFWFEKIIPIKVSVYGEDGLLLEVDETVDARKLPYTNITHQDRNKLDKVTNGSVPAEMKSHIIIGNDKVALKFIICNAGEHGNGGAILGTTYDSLF